MPDHAPQVTLGRILYVTWHAPLGLVQRMRDSGACNLVLARAGEAAMRRAALRLPAVAAPEPDAPEVYFLSGRRFAHQTVFCAASLACHAGRAFRVVIVDDGTLQDAELRLFRHVLPGIRVVGPAEIERALDRCLPRARFPRLREHRTVYPHIRKLTDVHALGGGYKLVLDSDMLFQAPPEFLLRWLAAPTSPCHMADVADAYGYSPALLAELAGHTLPSRVNVGICGLSSDDIPWQTIERWCNELLVREGSHYLLEQALVAMLMVSCVPAVPPATAYVVSPNRDEVRHPQAVLHHYTAGSKAWYYRFGWRAALARLAEVNAGARVASP